MSADIRYWIWLQLCLGCSAHFKDIIDSFGSVEKLYSGNILEWKMNPSLIAKRVENLQRYSLDDTEHIVYDCEQNGWDIIAYDDIRYPKRLKSIPNPPAVLYVDGKLPDIDASAAVSIVGTRKASSYAVKAAEVMAKGITRCGALVVSGGALGVDSAAHCGALDAGGKTVAVLGNGLGSDYLQKNRNLRERIRQNGALVTEYPPFTPASKYTFPMRNRIISALSLGVLVVEAGVKSGSLITAKYAYEQGRDIFAIPASIFDYNFYGTNKLIDDGAFVATSPEVILAQYKDLYNSIDMSKLQTVRELLEEDRQEYANAPKRGQVKFDEIVKDRAQNVKRQNESAALTGDERAVYDALSDNFQHIDLLIESTRLEPQKVLAAITILEMKGLAESASGKRYRLK